MRLLIIIASFWALVASKPELYKEKEDFQFSRSSSDDGTKSGFYGAQRGNMGGNYERAHNMDSLAQHQMSTLVRNVDGELGEGANTRTGNVFAAANSRGLYGSGNYDLSNLRGRNFGESAISADALSQIATSQNSGYSDYTGYGSTHSAANKYSTGQTQSSGLTSGYRSRDTTQYLQTDLQKAADNIYGTGNYEYDSQGVNKYQFGQSNSQTQSGYDNSHSASAYDHKTGSSLIRATPVRVYIRPGTRIAIPVAAQVYDANAIYGLNTVNSGADILDTTGQQLHYKPTNNAKHYESSYSYRKEWEKKDSIPVTVAPTENPFPQNSELYDDAQLSQTANNQYERELASAGTSHASSAESASAYGSSTKNVLSSQSKSQTYNSGASSLNAYKFGSSSSNAHNSGASDLNAYDASLAANLLNSHSSDGALHSNNLLEDISTRPKSYHSSYSYHKSWERRGDPYVIKPVGGDQISQKLSAQSGYACTYCLDDSQQRVRRSINTNDNQHNSHDGQQDFRQPTINRNRWGQEESQTQQKLEDLGQQTQSHWGKLEDLGQQAQNQLNNLGELSQQPQLQDKLEDLGQQTQSHWGKLEDLGQQAQNQWDNLADFSQQSQTQQKLEDLGQQTQSHWGKLEDLGQQAQNQLNNFGDQQSQLQDKLEDLGQQTQSHWGKQEDLGQQAQNQWGDFSQQSQTQQKLEDLGQQTQSHWGKLENLGQQAQNQLNNFGDLSQQSQLQDKLEDLGQQTQSHWGKLEDLGQQAQNEWDHLGDFSQQSQTQQKLEDLGQQTQSHWGKLEDLGQQAQNQLNNFGDLSHHAQDQLDNMGQQTQTHWGKLEGLGQQTQNQWDHLGDFSHHAQDQLDNMGQQTQTQWDKLRDLSHREHTLENLGQQVQNQWHNFGEQSQIEDKLEDLGQHTQSQLEGLGQHVQNQGDKLGEFSQQAQDKLEDLGQQTQSQLEGLGQHVQNLGDRLEEFGQQSQDKLEDLGQQTQTQWDKLGDLSQQSRSHWGKLEDLNQQPHNNWMNQENFNQQTQSHWGKLDDFGQQTHRQWGNLENAGQQPQNIWSNLDNLGQQENLGQQGSVANFGQETQYIANSYGTHQFYGPWNVDGRFVPYYTNYKEINGLPHHVQESLGNINKKWSCNLEGGNYLHHHNFHINENHGATHNSGFLFNVNHNSVTPKENTAQNYKPNIDISYRKEIPFTNTLSNKIPEATPATVNTDEVREKNSTLANIDPIDVGRGDIGPEESLDTNKINEKDKTLQEIESLNLINDQKDTSKEPLNLSTTDLNQQSNQPNTKLWSELSTVIESLTTTTKPREYLENNDINVISIVDEAIPKLNVISYSSNPAINDNQNDLQQLSIINQKQEDKNILDNDEYNRWMQHMQRFDEHNIEQNLTPFKDLQQNLVQYKEPFEGQNMVQQVSFGKQNFGQHLEHFNEEENIVQELPVAKPNSKQYFEPLQDFGPQLENFEQKSLGQQMPNFDIQNIKQDLESYDKQNINQLETNNIHVDALEDFDKKYDGPPDIPEEQTVRTISKNDIGQKVEPSAVRNIPQNSNSKQLKNDNSIPIELSTEKPGFWNSVWNKTKSAKDTVVSWFQS